MNHYTACRELTPYLCPTPAMRIGAPGKHGRLNLTFELDEQHKSILKKGERQAPLIVQQALYFDESMPEMPCVYILSSGGPHVDGDRYEHTITMRKNSYAFISTGASTKIAEMIYNFSSLQQHFIMEENSYLEYLPEPTIPCRNSRYIADTHINIHPTASLFYSEIYTGGRKYHNKELLEYNLLSISTQAERPDGTTLFREKMVITPPNGTLRHTGILSHYDVWGEAIVLTPQEHAEAIYAQTSVFIQQDPMLAIGIHWLPNHCGLIFRALSKESYTIKKAIRSFASIVRQEIKGKPLPEEFSWR